MIYFRIVEQNWCILSSLERKFYTLKCCYSTIFFETPTMISLFLLSYLKIYRYIIRKKEYFLICIIPLIFEHGLFFIFIFFKSSTFFHFVFYVLLRVLYKVIASFSSNFWFSTCTLPRIVQRYKKKILTVQPKTRIGSF